MKEIFQGYDIPGGLSITGKSVDIFTQILTGAPYEHERCNFIGHK